MPMIIARYVSPSGMERPLGGGAARLMAGLGSGANDFFSPAGDRFGPAVEEQVMRLLFAPC